MDVQGVIDDEFWTINTFVFIDLETTGLIEENRSYPRVTEIALIAVSRDNFLNCKSRVPRVMHKLILLFNPNTEIPDIVQNMTKLNKELLKNEKYFDIHGFNAITNFMTRLSKPICLVAHNGDQFDFPILLNEFKLIKPDFLSDLPEGVLCLDTLTGFKEILKYHIQDSPDVILLTSQSTSMCRLSNDHTYPKTYSSSNENTENIKNNATKSRSPTKLIENHKLSTIYKYLHGCPTEQEHNAEEDSITLLKCCLKVKEKFVNWADLNASLLKNY